MAEQNKILERVYNIPLRKEVQKAPNYMRAKKAISAIRKFVRRHMKSDDIKIGKYLNEKIWEHGIKNVPHHIKADCIKDEKGIVSVELFGIEKKQEEAKKEPKAEAKKVETKVEKVEEIKQPEKPREELAKEIQKEEIKELQKEKPKVHHKPKAEAKPKDLHLRKKEMIPVQAGR